MKKKLTVNEIIKRLSSKKVGDEFILSDLFTSKEWEGFGSSVSAGGANFYKKLNSDPGLQKRVMFLGTCHKSQCSKYKKLTNN